MWRASVKQLYIEAHECRTDKNRFTLFTAFSKTKSQYRIFHPKDYIVLPRDQELSYNYIVQVDESPDSTESAGQDGEGVWVVFDDSDLDHIEIAEKRPDKIQFLNLILVQWLDDNSQAYRIGENLRTSNQSEKDLTV